MAFYFRLVIDVILLSFSQHTNAALGVKFVIIIACRFFRRSIVFFALIESDLQEVNLVLTCKERTRLF